VIEIAIRLLLTGIVFSSVFILIMFLFLIWR